MSKDHQINPNISPKLQELASQQEQEVQEQEQEQEEGDEKEEQEEGDEKEEQEEGDEQEEQEEGEGDEHEQVHHQVLKDHHHDQEEEECKTPTSSDHKIPTIRSCPPTPRKKVQKSFLHKRKLPEFQFFEATNRDEVESFFRSNLLELSTDESPPMKRRCRSY